MMLLHFKLDRLSLTSIYRLAGMSKIAIPEKINGTEWDGTGQNEIEQ